MATVTLLENSSRPTVNRLAMCALALAMTVLVSGCGAVKLVARANIPTPLVVKVPVTVAVYVPKEFSEFVHKEERWSTDWNMDLGKAQSDGFKHLLNSMFEKVVVVDSIEAGTQLGSDVRAILEPSVEEYAFVTPRDAGSPFYAVSVKYRMNIYSPDGRLADSWGFTGYGTAPAQGLSSSTPLSQATALAMRDAGAKLAVEFREQAIVHSLLPDAPAPESQPAPTAPATTTPATTPTAIAPTTPAPTPSAATPTPESAAVPPQPTAEKKEQPKS